MHCNEKDPAGHNQDPVCRNEDLQPNKRIKKKEYGRVYYSILPPSVGDILDRKSTRLNSSHQI